MAKKLPKKLYIKIDGNPGEEFYNASDELFHLVEMGVKVKVGVYQLVELTEAEGVVETSRPRR